MKNDFYKIYFSHQITAVEFGFVFFRFGDESHDYYGPVITTDVLEIIDDRTFKTKNSIYIIITERDENIEKILQ